MKWILFCALFCTGLKAAPLHEWAQIIQPCSEHIECPEMTGPYSVAWAKIDIHQFTANQDDATCCQLTATIQTLICAEKLEPRGVDVLCR